MNKINVVILSGGWSSEREVSIKSGKAVTSALDRKKFEVINIDPKYELQTLINLKGSIDVVFVLLHGNFGEDGRIQGFLDILGVPYVGSGVLASALCMDKAISKQLYSKLNLLTPEWLFIKNGKSFNAKAIMSFIGSKVVIKPVCEGSSVGVFICDKESEICMAINEVFALGEDVLIEKYIKGTEVTCCVLGNNNLEALPIIEIIPDKRFEFFNYEAKYTTGATNEICPARIKLYLADIIYEISKTVHYSFKCKTWSRSDFIIEGDNVYILETNTLPGMTENSLFPLAARTAGIPFHELVERLIFLSIER